MIRPWLLLLFALPTSAEQLEVDLTGRSFDPQTQTSGTFSVSFDIDTLSGLQSYNVDSPLVSYSAWSLAITNLTAEVNGANIFSVPATTATLEKDGSPFTRMMTQGPDSLLWEFDVNSAVSITDRDDPLLGLLTKSFAPFYGASEVSLGHAGNPAAFLGDQISVRISPVGVPEPPVLALLLPALGALLLWQRRGRRPASFA